MGDFMRKALLPLLVSLLIAGTATGALIATSAHAGQTKQQPKMVLAQNQPGPNTERQAGPPPPDMDDDMMRGPRRGQFCQDIFARRAGELAFMEAKLQLTPDQQPLFARWKEISLDIAKRHEAGCDARVDRFGAAGQRPDMMERLNREEEMLKARLADIDAERPALTALYAALTPTQKQEVAAAVRHRMAGRMHRMMGMMHDAPEMGRRMGRGPAGEPPLPQPPPQ